MPCFTPFFGGRPLLGLAIGFPPLSRGSFSANLFVSSALERLADRVPFCLAPGDSSISGKAICLPTVFLVTTEVLLPLTEGVFRPPGVLGSPPLPTALFGVAADATSAVFVFRVVRVSALSSLGGFNFSSAPREAVAPFFEDLPFVVLMSHGFSAQFYCHMLLLIVN